jgi:hypothetical protein
MLSNLTEKPEKPEKKARKFQIWNNKTFKNIIYLLYNKGTPASRTSNSKGKFSGTHAYILKLSNRPSFTQNKWCKIISSFYVRIWFSFFMPEELATSLYIFLLQFTHKYCFFEEGCMLPQLKWNLSKSQKTRIHKKILPYRFCLSLAEI